MAQAFFEEKPVLLNKSLVYCSYSSPDMEELLSLVFGEASFSISKPRELDYLSEKFDLLIVNYSDYLSRQQYGDPWDYLASKKVEWGCKIVFFARLMDYPDEDFYRRFMDVQDLIIMDPVGAVEMRAEIANLLEFG